MNSAIKSLIPYIIIWILWFVFKDRVEEKLYNPVTIQAFMWSGIVFIAALILVWEKYRTPSFICQDLHGSSFYPPIEAGAYNIRTLGDLEFLGIRGRDAVVVTDKNLDYKLGRQTLSLTSCIEVKKEQLPMIVQNKIIELNVNPQRYYFSVQPLSLICYEKDFILKQDVMLWANQTLSLIYNFHDGDYKKIEEAVEHSGKLADRLDRRNFIAKFFGDFRKPNNPDNGE